MLEPKYCPICMQELAEQGSSNYACKLCKVVFYIVSEYTIDSPCLMVEGDNE